MLAAKIRMKDCIIGMVGKFVPESIIGECNGQIRLKEKENAKQW